VAIGDFNNDTKLDLVTPNGRSTDDSISVLLGNWDGTFQNQTTYTVGNGPTSVTVDDFNNDSTLDIVTSNSDYFDNTISVLLGNGHGAFQNQTKYTVGKGASSVTVGDFNNDTRLDLVVANARDNSVSVLLGNGDGTFQVQMTYPTSLNPQSIISADLNNDTKLDLTVTNADDCSVCVLLGNGDGTFQNKIIYTVGLNPLSLTVGAFKNDKKLDLAVANAGEDSLTILLNSCS
jgi:hypothetical protein